MFEAHEIVLVVATATNRTIGRKGELPWHLPADLKRFKSVTMSHPMIMGRTTFESIGRVLPGRPHIVVTRNADWSHAGVEVVHDIEAGIKAATAHGTGKIMVIGGAQIYAQTLDHADVLDVCEVQAEVEGDAHFPEIDAARWREVSREEHAAGTGDHAYHFVRYERV